MVNTPKDSTTAVKVVCAIIFVVFVVSYVYSFQGDLLAMTQNIWAKGQTHYHRGVGVVVITLILSLVSLGVGVLTHLPQRAFSLVFFPAFLLLGLLTAVHVDGTSVHTSMPWLVATPVMFVAYCFLMGQIRYYQSFLTPLRSTRFLSHPWWTNVLLLVGMMILTYSMGNTDRTLHTRLEVERHCQQRDWNTALAVGFPQYDNDSSLTMLRALALANVGQLGDKLFAYDVSGGSLALVPQPDHSVAFMLGSDKILWRTIGVVPRDRGEALERFLKRELRRGTVNDVAKDYLLCSYLMDRNLKAFVAALPSFYPNAGQLPTHYAEAYLLYCDRFKVKDTLTTQAMKADYADFLAVMRTNRRPELRDAAIRDAYFGTYWYYYFRKRQ